MTTVTLLAFLGLVLIGWVHAQETGPPSSALVRQARTYEFLQKYGYFDNLPNKTPGERPNQDEVRKALRSMQRVAGIPVTGEIDDETVEMLSKPRCGVKDVDPEDMMKSRPGHRERRFSVLGAPYKWFKTDLTYKILNYPGDKSPDLDMEQVNEDIVAAFKVWSDVTPLTFTEKQTDDADIKILFGGGAHTRVIGDPSFDGPGGTLAHAFTPNSGWGNMDGDVHIDDDETFTKGVYTGTNLFYTLTHEIGHAIGLFHSDVSDSLMWPYDRGYIPDFKLPQDDISGIQSLYGPNPNPPLNRPYCNVTFDATAFINDEYYMFGNNLLWRFDVNRNLLSPQEGQSPLDIFARFPNGVKAVYAKEDGTVIVLKGKNYWLYEVSTSSTSYYPRFQLKDIIPEMKTDFPQHVRELGFPKSVRGVVHLANVGFSYLIKGRAVYTFDENRLELSQSSVQVSSVFEGVSERPTSAFYAEGFANVLIGRDYYSYVYDYATSSFIAVRGYPQNFAERFLLCPPTGKP